MASTTTTATTTTGTGTARPVPGPGAPGEPAGPGPRIRSRRAAVALAVAAGGLIALAMPPYGWWPLVFAGIAVWDRLLAGASWRQRLARTYLLAVVWYIPTITWSWDLSPPGYVLAVLVMSGYVAAAGAATPPQRHRRVVFPGAVVIAQYLIGVYPWGGVPVAHLALTQTGSCAPPCAQIDSPLLNAARIGGPPLVIALVVIAGQALASLADAVTARPAARRRAALAAAAGAAVVAVTTAAGAVAPRGHDVGALHLAVVQGGGPQRTPPGNGDAPVVFQRHVDATRELVKPPVDLVVWPENVVAVSGRLADSAELAVLEELARELRTTLVVGATEELPGERAFLNASVVINPDGSVGDRYDKVHRVPFGEFVPHRALVEHLAPPDAGLPTRDAIPGTGTGRLHTPVADVGIVISFEDFFPGRARDAVGDGGEVLMNPTNGASYWLTQVQTQQIASSRLRAVETGRWHVQAAPTGFSSVITPEGVLLARTDVSERRVLDRVVQRRSGQTISTLTGPGPVLALAALAVAAGWWAGRPRRRSRPARRPTPAPDPPAAPPPPAGAPPAGTG